MSPYLKALARFRNKIDFEISKQSNAISIDFLLRNYANANLEDLIELRGYYKGLKIAREMLYRTIAEQKGNGGRVMVNNHFADVGKKGTMSLTHALIVLDRLNTTERIDVARDNLAEAVQVVSAAAKYRIPQKPEKSNCYWATSKTKMCPTCKCMVLCGTPRFCTCCGQALDWR